jgi:molybdate/tungstate transport system substrate-binding protein
MHRLAGALLLAGGLFACAAQAAEPFRVAYAGSMGVVMDHVIGPAFAKENGVDYQGIGQGAYGLAHQIEGKLLQADVFISITPGPIEILKKVDMVGPALPVASTEMVIAYSAKSKFAADLDAAAQGKKNWYEVLQSPGLRFGRTDPATDPQGQNIVFTMLLAQNVYRQPGMVEKVLGPYQNPQQILAEPSLLSRLDAGQIDASSGYLSAVKSRHLPFIKLADEVNLSNPDMDAKYYKTVKFDITLPNGKVNTLNTQPLVFYATVLKDSKQHALAEKFVQFLLSAQGQKMLEDNGYSKPKGGTIQ